MKEKTIPRRTKILLIVLIVLVIGGGYYSFVQRPVSQRTDAANSKISSLEDSLAMASAKASKQKQMEECLSANPSLMDSEVASYNNLKTELRELNAILKSADFYSLSFSEAEQDGNWISRSISVSFQTKDYSTARAIINEIYNCKYRLMIKTMDIADQMNREKEENRNLSDSEAVVTTMEITFYETSVGSEATNGTVASDESSDDTSTDGDILNFDETEAGQAYASMTE